MRQDTTLGVSTGVLEQSLDLGEEIPGEIPGTGAQGLGDGRLSMLRLMALRLSNA